MIIPFRGYRYSSKAGALKDLIAPPYDVIGSEYRKQLINRSKYNIVHLTLPESFDSDYHLESGSKLDLWCKEKILVQDNIEQFYLLSQRFCANGKTLTRYGFIALFDLKKADCIIKHEIAFGKYIDDRIKLLKATKSNLEPIFLVFEDRENLLEKTVQNFDYRENFDFEDCSIKFAPCHPEVLSQVIENIEKGNLFIADGHHRFQASLEFFKQNPGAPQYIMVYLTAFFSDALLSLPTHRVVRIIPTQEKIEAIKKYFLIEEKGSLEETLNSIKDTGNISFGVYFSGRFQVWKAFEIQNIKKFLPDKFSDDLKSLDVVVLHYFILEKIFNIPAKEKLYYSTNPQALIDYVNQNSESTIFFMQPPDLMKIKRVSLNGEILPPKTTYFYPKVPSGLVIARYD